MEDDILIENYLKGKLSQTEVEAFERRLEIEGDFKQTFELEEQLFKTLNEEEWYSVKKEEGDIKDYVAILESDTIQGLRKTLTKVSSSHELKKSNGIKRVFYYVAAASIAVLLVLGYQLFFSQTKSNDTLYAKYSMIDDLPSFVSRSDESSQLAEAQSLFENKKFEQSLQLFENAQGLTNEGLILVYTGLAQIELERYEAAEKSFNTLINSELLDAEKGYWYKALLFVKSDKGEDAKQILRKIVSESYYNHPKAAELLSELDS